MKQNYNFPPNPQRTRMSATAKHSFLKMIHELWIADIGDMQDYLSCLEALMSRYGVNWKGFAELDSSDIMNKAVDEDFEMDKVFAYFINDRSKDVFENFACVCNSLMDFSQMLTQNLAA